MPQHIEGVGSIQLRVVEHRPSSICTILHLDVRSIADAIGYPAAGLGILVESAGIPFPGETMTIAAAAYAASGALVWAVLVSLAGFYLGRNWGLVRRLVEYLGMGGVMVVIVVILGLWLFRRRALRSGL